MRDQKNSTKPVMGLTAAVRTADATSSTIDRLGADALTFVLCMGAGGITFDSTNKIEVVMQHSDDDSTYTACTAAECLVDSGVTVASGIVKSFVAAHATATAYTFGYRGSKRYVQVKLDFSGTHGTGTATAVAALLGNLSYAPQ